MPELTPDQQVDQKYRKQKFIEDLKKLEADYEVSFKPLIGAEGPYNQLVDNKNYEDTATTKAD